MKRRTYISMCALLGVMVAGLAQGATIRFQGDGDYTNMVSLTPGIGWTTAGSGPGGLPGSADQIRVNYGTGSVGNTCTLTTVAPNVANFQLGVDQSGTMVVESGAVLTTGASSANAVGYNRADIGVTGLMTVKTNGVVYSGYYLRVGYTGIGVLTIDGGTVNDAHHLWVGGGSLGNGTIILTNGGTLNMTATNGVGNGMLGLGTGDAVKSSGGVGYIYVRGGGVLNLYNIDQNGNSITNGSVLDISGSGMVTFPGDKTSVLTNNYIIPGKITAFAGTGTVAIDYNVSNPGKTTLKAVGGYVPPTDCTWTATSGPGFWNDSTNWSCGSVPVSVTLVTFNVPSAIPCIVKATAWADSIDIGTNGPGGTLIVTNSGTLACIGTNANFIGNNSNALMVVENGTSATFGGPVRIGFDVGADGTLLMNGGTVSVAGMFDLGYQGGKGTAQIKGGTLNLARFDDIASMGGPSWTGVAQFDITGTGTVVLNADHSLAMNYYISTGQITNSSGAGLLVDYGIIHSGKTTVYPADLPLAPEQVIWNPALLNASDPNGLWNVSTNWNMPMCPGNATVVLFNVADAIPCIVTNAAVAGYVDMGTLAGPGGTLIVTNGGSLTTFANNWSAVGYDSNALMIVESGSSASFAGHLWVGFNAVADGTLTINGGTVSVGQMFGLGWNGGKGTAQINNGTLNLAQWHPTDSIKGASSMNLTGTGTVLITGNYVTSISNFVAVGKITANGGAGTVVYGFDPVANKTAIQVAPPRQSVTGVAVSGGNTTLTCQTTAGHIYHIESTPSLSPTAWTRVAGTTTNAPGASVTFTFPAGSGQVFYRTVSP
jgi:hypothetical protein